MRLRILALCFGVALARCQGPQVQPPSPPQWESQEMEVLEQGLTDFTLKLTGRLIPKADAVLERASYELVVDGNVVSKGEQPLAISVSAGQTGTFVLQQTSRYVQSAENLAEMSLRGGSLLCAIRGVVFVRQGTTTVEVPFARSRDIRVPRLPTVKLHELDAGRFSEKELQATFYLGVVNPNPFPMTLKGLNYAISIEGKKLDAGTLGAGEKVAKAATGVFEIQLTMNEETFGRDMKKLVAGMTLPYQIQGDVSGELFLVPYRLSGDIKVNVSR